MNTLDKIVNAIVEDLDDIPQDTPVTYEVWAIGYDSDENLTDTSILLKSTNNPDEAIAFAKDVTVASVTEHLRDTETEFKYFSIEVETVIEVDDDETANIGTIFYHTIYYKGNGEDVSVSFGEYELLEDGNLKIPCSKLQCFNKNDYIKILFADEEEQTVLTYKIISRVICDDGEYYICEFIY